jgi:hypothetical protein
MMMIGEKVRYNKMKNHIGINGHSELLCPDERLENNFDKC